MKDNYNISAKEMKDVVKQARSANRKDTQAYGYYSRVLEQPFDSVEELKAAEDAHYAKLKAKEDQAAAKKAEAKKVEDAFIALNAARKTYKAELQEAATTYSEELIALKERFEKVREDIHKRLEAAETAYDTALKEFVDKHPEGYHLTLKDGDFETTISGNYNKEPVSILNLFDLLF